MTSRSAVLGCWTTLEPALALAFCRSVRAHAPSSQLVLFVGNVGRKQVAELEAMADDVVVVDDMFPSRHPEWAIRALSRVRRQRGLRRFYPGAWRAVARATLSRPGTAAAEALEYRTQGLQSLRYGIYRRYLRDHPEIEAAVISDVRDVVFQRDPFALPIEGLEVFLEDERHRLDQPTFNRRWILDLYGQLGADAVATCQASCSGVTVGGRDALLRYLSSMENELSRHWGPLGSHDQGVHNYLLHTGQLSDPLIQSNGEGRVLTLGGADEAVLEPDGTVRWSASRITPSIVHQYDRHPEIERAVHERYG